MNLFLTWTTGLQCCLLHLCSVVVVINVTVKCLMINSSAVASRRCSGLGCICVYDSVVLSFSKSKAQTYRSRTNLSYGLGMNGGLTMPAFLMMKKAKRKAKTKVLTVVIRLLILRSRLLIKMS